jgi:UDP-2-acetamido-2,6-beta-L-arabino-hexul-4-ose reductase
MLGEVHRDERGELMEFSDQPGQIYVSVSRKGAVRANHYHTRKTEKFLVVAGRAVIRIRQAGFEKVNCIPVDAKDFRIVTVFPRQIHSITNIGAGDMVLVVWSSEVFNPADPDTFTEEI